MVYQPVAPLDAATKNLQRTASRGRFVWAHTLRVQSIKAGKAWWQEGEVTGHVTSTVRKWTNEQWCSACCLCFIHSRTPAPLGPFYPSYHNLETSSQMCLEGRIIDTSSRSCLMNSISQHNQGGSSPKARQFLRLEKGLVQIGTPR